MLYLNLDAAMPDYPHPIEPCNHRPRGGGARCPAACLGHYEYGATNNNEILLAVAHLGSVEWFRWSDSSHDCSDRWRTEPNSFGVEPTSVRMFRNDTAFKAADGTSVTTYPVLINRPNDLGPYVCLLSSSEAAEELCRLAVEGAEDRCVCEHAN